MDTPVLVPARMLNEYVYCPRLAFIEWLEHDFRDNAFTVDGRYQHRRVDQAAPAKGLPPAPDGDLGDGTAEEVERVHARSVELSAPRAGIIARVDVVEAEGPMATPVEYKRGRPPKVLEGAYLPERVQLCAQVMVLEENGYRCPGEALLYFAEARRRVPIAITDELRATTLQAVEELRALALADRPAPPPVLIDSPRCVGCSLAGLCLPDEIGLLTGARDSTPRRLFPHVDDALPFHVQQQGGRLGKQGDCLRLTDRDGKILGDVRLRHTSQVAVYGNVQVSTQAIRALREHEVPLTFSSFGGWFYGLLAGLPHGNVDLRRRQFAAAEDPARALPIARSVVDQKIRNQRTLLRRNHPAGEELEVALGSLRRAAHEAREAASSAELLGIEGSAARTYFQLLPGMFHPRSGLPFDMEGRNRRPPRDPINALLSYLYGVLTRELTIVATAVGFDPLLGFFHRPRHGRPSLALDLMEPFRPLLADSVVLTVVNKGIVRASDFIEGAGAVAIKLPARKRLLQAYEHRLDEQITHPVFGYRVSYRRTLEVQTRLLARYLAGEVPEPPSLVTR